MPPFRQVTRDAEVRDVKVIFHGPLSPSLALSVQPPGARNQAGEMMARMASAWVWVADVTMIHVDNGELER